MCLIMISAEIKLAQPKYRIVLEFGYTNVLTTKFPTIEFGIIPSKVFMKIAHAIGFIITVSKKMEAPQASIVITPTPK